MNIKVQRFLKRMPDDTGTVIGVWLERYGGGEVHLEMTMPQGNSLMAQIAQCGLVAAEKHGDPDTPQHGAVNVLTQRTTYTDASYGPNGEPMLTFLFGRTSLGVRLTNEQARLLSEQLGKLATNTPQGKTSGLN